MKKKLNKRQQEELWGKTGPYSQAHLIKEVRILDNTVSRVFLIVEVDINPTTFECMYKHRSDPEFVDDEAIQQLLDHSEDRRPFSGYVSMAYEREYSELMVITEAELALSRVQKTIVKMHQFVMDSFL